mmetsp:Transcript_2017/g.4556  ORF Transcript_2017/g.4556 Transcript_2017/m.4556 type:complete len:87 (+) Transcript_2017:6970-7230(+)
MSFFDSSMQFLEKNFEKVNRTKSAENQKKKLFEMLQLYTHQVEAKVKSEEQDTNLNLSMELHQEIKSLTAKSSLLSVVSDSLYSFE